MTSSMKTVIDNLETEARRLIDRCGLAWDPNCLDFHETRRVVRTASYRQVREPVYKRSVGKWRNYAAALDPLTASAVRAGHRRPGRLKPSIS